MGHDDTLPNDLLLLILDRVPLFLDSSTKRWNSVRSVCKRWHRIHVDLCCRKMSAYCVGFVLHLLRDYQRRLTEYKPEVVADCQIRLKLDRHLHELIFYYELASFRLSVMSHDVTTIQKLLETEQLPTNFERENKYRSTLALDENQMIGCLCRLLLLPKTSDVYSNGQPETLADYVCVKEARDTPKHFPLSTGIRETIHGIELLPQTSNTDFLKSFLTSWDTDVIARDTDVYYANRYHYNQDTVTSETVCPLEDLNKISKAELAVCVSICKKIHTDNKDNKKSDTT